MGNTPTLRFEAEIRNTEPHTSDAMADDAGATVVEDKLHPHTLNDYSDIRVYIDDDHDEAFDITIRHTHTDDDDFSGEVDSTTISLSSGGDSATATIAGPVGRIRIHFATGALASAATAGSTVIRIEAA